MTSGPTQMMRFEHTQMRALSASMLEAAETKDRDSFLSSSETLLVLMQQHNIKEEQVLYPMSDGHLADEAGGIIARMAPYRTV
jgi:hemerythrin-like domain-containing protein